jgi:hypothetical protein
MIGASISFADESKAWLTGLSHADGSGYDSWIRSGTNCPSDAPGFCDYDILDADNDSPIMDEDEVFENILSGTWAPYRMVGYNIHSPMTDHVIGSNMWRSGLLQNASLYDEAPHYQLNYLHNVDLYITADKSLWTRSVVLEMQDDPSLAEGGQRKWAPRLHASIDKDGNYAEGAGSSDDPNSANYIAGTGMGWFPGYAIDLETGERLNIAFGEDSYLISENGNDMIWNPTETVSEGLNSASDIRYGGKHTIFIMRNNILEENVMGAIAGDEQPEDITRQMPAYDAGAFMHEKLSNPLPGIDWNYLDVLRSGMWTGFPLLVANQELLATDARVSFRVNQQFKPWSNGTTRLDVGSTLEAGKKYLVQRGPVVFDGVEYNRNQVIEPTASGILSANANTGADVIENVIETENGGLPLFGFTLEGLAPESGVTSVETEALDMINVVPNPYYAYSEYELDKVDYRVKLINLPERCDIKIYTLNGVLIRTYSKADPSVTSIDWDLKNEARIPVASGVYLIHVNVPGVGERVIKWFGVLRPIELDSF